MSTRGIFGFQVNGEVKCAYNHFDSYPEGLGNVMVDAAIVIMKLYSRDELLQKIADMKMVNEDEKPTTDQIKALEQYADLNVSRQSVDDWYCLMRDLQSEPVKCLEVGYMLDGSDFPLDSLFCEWGYIINTDDMTLDMYEGFQKAPHSAGFWGGKDANREGYYPIRQIGKFPVADLREGFMDTVAENMSKFWDEDEYDSDLHQRVRNTYTISETGEMIVPVEEAVPA